MLVYTVVNTREDSVTVDGLGVLPPESAMVCNPEQVSSFQQVRGLNFLQTHLPEGVHIDVEFVEEV